jgi:hypothetical protein
MQIRLHQSPASRFRHRYGDTPCDSLVVLPTPIRVLKGEPSVSRLPLLRSPCALTNQVLPRRSLDLDENKLTTLAGVTFNFTNME